MTGGEWSSPSNYRSCCELVDAEVLLGFSHCTKYTGHSWVCVSDFICHLLHVSVYVSSLVFSQTFLSRDLVVLNSTDRLGGLLGSVFVSVTNCND